MMPVFTVLDLYFSILYPKVIIKNNFIMLDLLLSSFHPFFLQ